MSEGRRVGGTAPGRRRSTASRRAARRRSGFGRTFDRLRNLTTSSPARFAVVVFVALILAVHGAAVAAGGDASTASVAPFADALFTAVSTICVTGLSTVDMATFLSPFGKFVIFLGVNIGGIGVLTLASILGLVISKRLGLRAKLIAASDTNPLRAPRRPRERGPDRAPRRGRPAAAHRGHCRRSSSRASSPSLSSPR